MNRLIQIAQLRKRLVVGLMSGTSADGIDAAVVEIEGTSTEMRLRMLAFETYPYPQEVAAAVRALQEGRTRDVCEMNFRLGDLFAQAALDIIKEAGLEPPEVHLIGSHGQTIYHLPDVPPPGCSTLQIGEPAVIAERTGITTVADFRGRDIAAGGFGAPLIPYIDFLLFRKESQIRALQNIGGIANVTVVTESKEDVFAFDTGPGNCLIDEFVRTITGSKEQFDRNGRRARGGRIQEDILRELLDHPYFSLEPPKTTGRELFGSELIKKLAAATPSEHHADMLATLTALTAHSIKLSYERFVLPRGRIDEVILSGGGCRNAYLVELLQSLLAPIPVRVSDEYGISADAKEAVGFAVLANETIAGNPSNLPSATGASHAVVLGKIVP